MPRAEICFDWILRLDQGHMFFNYISFTYRVSRHTYCVALYAPFFLPVCSLINMFSLSLSLALSFYYVTIFAVVWFCLYHSTFNSMREMICRSVCYPIGLGMYPYLFFSFSNFLFLDPSAYVQIL